MSAEARCSNPGCGIVLTLRDELAGKKVRCPQCGATIQVPEVVGAPAPQVPAGGEFQLSAPQPAPSAPPSRPAKAACQNCGAELGAGLKSCPKCGAAAPGGAAVEEPEKARATAGAKPRLVAVGIGILALVLIGGGALLALNRKALKRTAEIEQEAAEAQDQESAARQRPVKPRQTEPSVRVPPEELAAAEAQTQKLRQSVEAYLARLAALAAAREVSTQEDMAAGWAQLYQFCRDSALPTEARMCWLRAVSLDPQNPATNAILGRTENFRGMPVTAPQKQFLDMFATRIRLLNHHSGLVGLKVGLEGGTMQDLPPSQSVEIAVQPGETALLLQVGEGDDQCTARISLRPEEGQRKTITLLSKQVCPVVPTARLFYIYMGLSSWDRSHNPLNPLPRQQLARMGWRKAEGGWVLKVRGKIVEFATDTENKLQLVRAGGVTLSRVEGGELAVRRMEMAARRQTVLQVQGRLHIPSEEQQSVTLIGTTEEPLELQLARSNEVGGVCCGTWQQGDLRRQYYLGRFEGKNAPQFSYTVEDYDSPMVKLVLGALSAERGRAAGQERVREGHEKLLTKLKDLEARGELLGDWHSDLWLMTKLEPLRANQQQARQREKLARALPFHTDRAGVAGIENPVPYMYLQWPQLRQALATVAGRAAAQTEERQTRISLLPLMPEAQAVAFVQELSESLKKSEQELREGRPTEERPPFMTEQDWEDFGHISRFEEEEERVGRIEGEEETPGEAPEQRVTPAELISAIWQLRLTNSPPVINLLATIAAEARGPETRAAAIVTLGEMGTRESLKPCRAPTIDRTLRAASLAALAGSGDAETLASLPRTLEASLPEVEYAFLRYLLGTEGPTSLLALSVAVDHYKDEQSRAEIARYLGHMGGHAAMALLARLMDDQKELYPSVVRSLKPEDMDLLVGPLSRILSSKSSQSLQAGLLLARTRSDAAATALKAAAFNKRVPRAVVALAVFGSHETLGAAAQVKDLVGPKQLATIRTYWRQGAPAEPWVWHPRVDRGAAVGFLRAILREGKNEQVRIAAAQLVVELGESPEPEGLVALAALPVGEQAATAGAGGRGREPTGPPAYLSMDEAEEDSHASWFTEDTAGRMAPGAPSARTRALEAWLAQRAEFQATAQMKALRLLEREASPNMAAGLRQLAEKASSPQMKAAALKLLGQVADEESKQYLLALASTVPEKYADTAAMLNQTEIRLGAAAGLAATGHPDAVGLLHGLVFEQPPATESFKKAPEERQYDSAIDRRAMVIELCACEVVLALPEAETLWRLARDKRQAEELIERFCLIAEQSALSAGTAPAMEELTASAIRCLGRAGKPSARAQRLFDLLAQAHASALTPAVCKALVDVLWVIGDSSASRRLTQMLPLIQQHEELRKHWFEVCRGLVARGRKGDYELLIKSLEMMPRPLMEELVAAASVGEGLRPETYYELLARAAALPISSKRTAPEKLRQAPPPARPTPQTPGKDEVPLADAYGKAALPAWMVSAEQSREAKTGTRRPPRTPYRRTTRARRGKTTAPRRTPTRTSPRYTLRRRAASPARPPAYG